MKKKYNRASIQKTADWEAHFALRTTRANSDLNLDLTEFKVAAMPLKIKSFLAIQIHKAMMITISRAKALVNRS